MHRHFGHVLYGIVALMLIGHALTQRNNGGVARAEKISALDIFILSGVFASAWPTQSPWSVIEWVLRLSLCGLIFVRLALLLFKYVVPHRLLPIIILAALLLAVAGAGFLWLEPKVQTYADGLWLAFITGATVGYGDLVPSTPASRIFAVFIVLLGYALFSVVTASIAALLVGEDEKRLSREMHADMRMLRKEIVALHAELHLSLSAADRSRDENRDTQ